MFRMAVTPKEIYITFTVCSKSACIAQTLITEYAHVRSRCRSHGKSYGFALNEKLSNWQTLASHTLGSRKVNISSYRVISVQYNDSARSYDRFHKRSLATWRVVLKALTVIDRTAVFFVQEPVPKTKVRRIYDREQPKQFVQNMSRLFPNFNRHVMFISAQCVWYVCLLITNLIFDTRWTLTRLKAPIN